MAVLVTGGAGYIGSHTVRALLEQDREVVVLDTLEMGTEDAVLGAPLVVGDIAVRPGVGFITERVRAFDGPTVGAGFSAATLRNAPVARSSGGMLTVAVVAF